MPRGDLASSARTSSSTPSTANRCGTIIAKGKHLSHVVHFGDQQVFDGATTYTCLLFLDKSPADECRFVQVRDLVAWKTPENGKNVTGGEPVAEGTIPASRITATEWNFQVGNGAALFRELGADAREAWDVADIFVGLQTSADDVFVMELVGETARTFRLTSKALGAEWTFEKDLLFPLSAEPTSSRTAPLPNRQYILFPYSIRDEKASLIDFKTISRQFPKTAAYLLENMKTLENREMGRMKGPAWHGYVYRKNHDSPNTSQILRSQAGGTASRRLRP